MSIHTATDQLPSLPQVLLNILDAIHQDTADFQQLANIIRHDASVTSKIISIANSSYFGRNNECNSIERALMYLGINTVKNIVVTTAIKQFFNCFNQDNHDFLNQFWHRSLITAHFGQTLANLTAFKTPDEAYLCGLLTDMGQLILVTEKGSAYLELLNSCNNSQTLLEQENRRYNTDHCSIAAELVDSWHISDFMGDAIRYHHEPFEQIQDAHHLVKINFLANKIGLACAIDDEILHYSYELFGLNEALTRELFQRIHKDIEIIATDLGITVPNSYETAQQAHQHLGQRLSDLGELNQLSQTLSNVSNNDEFYDAIKRTLLLTFGINDCIIFDYNINNQLIISQNNHDTVKDGITITVQSKRSICSDAILSKSIQYSKNNPTSTLSVIDRQLLRLCHANYLLAVPLCHNDSVLGVLALGVNAQHNTIENRFNQILLLGKEIAKAYVNYPQNQENITDNNPLQNSIREAIHEASNPLSIIRNYLETLRIKLGADHSATENIKLIREEIDRVGNILVRLNDPENNTTSSTAVNINALIRNIVKIFNDSLFIHQNIDLTLSLDENAPPLNTKTDHIKQILTNLLKNAAEAQPDGGSITIKSQANTNINGRLYTKITVRDNGPGIPENIKKGIFSPVASTKQGNHSGLGLSIVKRLAEEIDAEIRFISKNENTKNVQSGTEFQLLLPQ